MKDLIMNGKYALKPPASGVDNKVGCDKNLTSIDGRWRAYQCIDCLSTPVHPPCMPT